ncbi:MAG: glycosyltransferase, partial [Pseudomonadota bacterium]
MTRAPDLASLRVGVVCFSTFGGSGVVAAEVGMALAERGHTVHVFSDDVPGRLDTAQPRVHFHPVRPAAYPQLKQSPYPLALTSKMVDVARRDGLDVIHAHYALPHAASAYLACAVLRGDRHAAAPVPRLVTTLHGTDITLVGSDASFLPLTQFSITASDAVTAPSAWLAAATFETLGIPASVQIDVIPNFVDADRFTPGPPSHR